ncbi:MAG TPA: hypothetical protein VNY04_09405, partial [Chthoniobacterales bacterium]|nr:hypothetical protein [Chthoniobacterales bacterium]
SSSATGMAPNGNVVAAMPQTITSQTKKRWEALSRCFISAKRAFLRVTEETNSLLGQPAELIQALRLAIGIAAKNP